MITQEELKNIMYYNPKTGVFRRMQRGRGIRISGKAGTRLTNGYLRVKIYGKSYSLHRLAWLYMTGSFPNGVVDHIDRDKSNNSWENLRIADKFQNMHNRKMLSNNSSGMVGLNWSKNAKMWEVRVMSHNKRYHYGTWPNIDDAKIVAKVAREMLHGDFASHGV